MRALPAVLIAALAVVALSAVPAASATSDAHFKSPSGNINCLGQGASAGFPAFVECMTLSAGWPHPRAKPGNCHLDWVPYQLGLGENRVGGPRGVSVGSCRGDVGPECSPSGTSFSCATLRYGHSVEIGPIRCTSAVTGVTCRYTTGLRVGFRIARQGYAIWRS